ncbi:MAG: hypothetical protein LBL82_02720 [Oscillospiraceae bacterium]|jgi:hypothetical protein|nr:hypothetical protein [Oscillospiraceae bacterium]
MEYTKNSKNRKNSKDNQNKAINLFGRKIIIRGEHIRIAKITGLVALAVFFISFIVYHWYINYYTNIVTEQALIVTLSDEIESTGITMRDETVLGAVTGGSVIPAVKNGDKVSKGQVIAYVFDSPRDAAAYNRMSEIEEEISEFESMRTAGEESAGEIDALNKLIEERINKLSEAVSEKKFSEIENLDSEIRYLLNKRQVCMNKVENFDSRIEQLRAEQEQLKSAHDLNPKEIKSEKSGYYSSIVDGYEEEFTTEKAVAMTSDEVREIIESHGNRSYADIYFGKISDDYKWNIVSIVPDSDAARLKTGNTYKIILPHSEIGSVEAKLEKIAEPDSKGEVLLLFTCNYLVSELSISRIQPIKIQVETYTGIGVKSSAIRIAEEEISIERLESENKIVLVNDAESLALIERINQIEDEDERQKAKRENKVKTSVTGVYAVLGSKVVFREINVLYKEEDGIAVCKQRDPNEGLVGNYIKNYDYVIVEGKGLYVGKFVSI